MERVFFKGGLELSRVVHGQMRMGTWNQSAQERLAFLEELVEAGITSFDHADIYGNYTCEALLGEALQLKPALRDRIEIITKCGIKLKSDKFPERTVKSYEYSYAHITQSVEQSLRNFGTDRIDLLLLHRPAPFFDPADVAWAFDDLKRAGKVLHFGVSNFLPGQVRMLQAYLAMPLATNQVEVSPWCHEHFDNGTIDFCLETEMQPMSWSPLGGGRSFDPADERGRRILNTLNEISAETGAGSPASVALTWLMSHPAGILPVVGSGRMERIREATDALGRELTLEQWYRIWTAGTGSDVA